MKSKVHELTIKVRFDAPLTRKEARYAVWNAIQYIKLYGDGKQSKRRENEEGRNAEPYSYGSVKVAR